MEIKEIAKDVYACMQEDKGFGCNNSGFINLGGGLVVDTFWDLNLTQQLFDLYGSIAVKPPKRLVNTHHNGDHCWGNQLFKGSEIIGHKLCAEAMQRDAKLPGMLHMGITSPENFPSDMKWFLDDISQLDFSGIQITPPNVFVEDRMDLDLDGFPCQIIYVGPAHTADDLIVYLPEHGMLFGGDLLWNGCTPIRWEGTHAKWLESIDMVLSFNPKVVVPGHGPLCGVEEIKQLRSYLEYVFTQSRRLYDEGLTPLEACKKIDLGPYVDWTQPERLVFNVSRAFVEFRGDPWNTPTNALDLIAQGAQLRKHWNEASQ
jgi:cyclase